MSFRPTVNVVMDGKILTDYFCKSYSEWSLLMFATELINECRNLHTVEDVMKQLNVTEIWDDMSDSEFPVIVDLSSRFIYHSKSVLSAEDVAKIPTLKLVSIIRAKQNATYSDEFFLSDGKISFETMDLSEFLGKGDQREVREFLSIVWPDVFTRLYEAGISRLPETQKQSWMFEVNDILDKLCTERVEGALRMKISLCLRKEAYFPCSLKELTDSIKQLIDRDYCSTYARIMGDTIDYPSILDFADNCFQGKNGIEKNVGKAMEVYKTLFHDYSIELREEVCAKRGFGEKPRPTCDAEKAMYVQVTRMLGELFSDAKNAEVLFEYVTECNQECDDTSGFDTFIDWKGVRGELHSEYFMDDDMFDYAVDDEEFTYDNDLYVGESGESKSIDDEADFLVDIPMSLHKKCDKSKPFRVCSVIAYGFFLKSRSVCEELLSENPVISELKAILDERIDNLKEFLGYPVLSELEIKDIDAIEEAIRAELECGLGELRIYVSDGDKCEVCVRGLRPSLHYTMRTSPELSMCSIERGYTFFADDIKYIALQKKYKMLVFDEMICIKYMGDYFKDRIRISFRMNGETVARIDAGIPLFCRMDDNEYDLKDDQKTDEAVLWMPIELTAIGLDFSAYDDAWNWAMEEIVENGITIPDDAVDLMSFSEFECAKPEDKHYALFCQPLEKKALVRVLTKDSVQYYKVGNLFTHELGVDYPLQVLLNNAKSLCETDTGRKKSDGLNKSLTYEEKLLLEPLDVLYLSLRSYNSLMRRGISTLGDLCAQTKESIRQTRNLGDKQVKEIEDALRKKGLFLKDDAVN